MVWSATAAGKKHPCPSSCYFRLADEIERAGVALAYVANITVTTGVGGGFQLCIETTKCTECKSKCWADTEFAQCCVFPLAVTVGSANKQQLRGISGCPLASDQAGEALFFFHITSEQC